jgi:hypothetical protein
MKTSSEYEPPETAGGFLVQKKLLGVPISLCIPPIVSPLLLLAAN